MWHLIVTKSAPATARLSALDTVKVWWLVDIIKLVSYLFRCFMEHVLAHDTTWRKFRDTPESRTKTRPTRVSHYNQIRDTQVHAARITTKWKMSFREADLQL
jgi:hypothetical protein